MNSIHVPAYAKVNLFLNVLGKRPDGYHELLTLFERVDLADQIDLELLSGTELQFTCSDPQVPQDGTNLVVRAAELYRKASGWQQGLKITLEKKIPVAAGLGGGSSDAAATLQALQRLSPTPLSEVELLTLARSLGADVPFFLSGNPWAVGRGRGDEIEPLEVSVRLWHLLVTPDVAIPTQRIYKGFSSSTGPGQGLTPPQPDVKLLFRALKDQHVTRVSELLFNALEPTVEALYPVIRRVKATLETLRVRSRPCVSGSGSTVFALMASREEASAMADTLLSREPRWRVFVASTSV